MYVSQTKLESEAEPTITDPEAPNPELAESWFTARAGAPRAVLSSRPPPAPAIDDPVADAWFL